MPQSERLRLILEENEWKNTLVMGFFPESLVAKIPHFWQTWLRCWILCMAVYYSVGSLWCYYTYFCFGDKLFAPGTIPAFRDIAEQIKVRSDGVCQAGEVPLAASTRSSSSAAARGYRAQRGGTRHVQPAPPASPGHALLASLTGRPPGVQPCYAAVLAAPSLHGDGRGEGLDQGVPAGGQRGPARLRALLLHVHDLRRVRRVLDAPRPARHQVGVQVSQGWVQQPCTRLQATCATGCDGLAKADAHVAGG
jgi:hypothetical protein